MKRFTDKELAAWVKERDEVIKSYDVKAFRAFYNKWLERGIYEYMVGIENDYLVAISLRKAVLRMASATEQEKNEARKWLIEHGMKGD